MLHAAMRNLSKVNPLGYNMTLRFVASVKNFRFSHFHKRTYNDAITTDILAYENYCDAHTCILVLHIVYIRYMRSS